MAFNGIRTNILTSERFNPPTVHESRGDGACAGICYVYDPAAWRNKNRPGAGLQKKEVRTAKPALDKNFSKGFAL